MRAQDCACGAVGDCCASRRICPLRGDRDQVTRRLDDVLAWRSKTIHKILVAYDGTDAADRAFEVALDVARRFDAHLYVAAVGSAAEAETHAMLDRLRIECAANLEPLRSRVLQAMLAQIDVDSTFIPENRAVVSLEAGPATVLIAEPRSLTFRQWQGSEFLSTVTLPRPARFSNTVHQPLQSSP